MIDQGRISRPVLGILAVVLLALPACATVEGRQSSAGEGRGEPPDVRILRSHVWIYRSGAEVVVEHRGIYIVTFGGETEDVSIIHRLKDSNGRTLSERAERKTRPPGVYPVTFKMQVPAGASRADRLAIELSIRTSFGSASDAKPFAFLPSWAGPPTDREKAMEIHSHLRSGRLKCPPGRLPAVREVADASGQVSEVSIECMRGDSPRGARGQIGLSYPGSGRFYPIERSRYPEFYRICDLDGNGELSMAEIGRIQRTLNDITRRHPEGDVDAIVREFMRTPIGGADARERRRVSLPSVSF